MAGINYYGTIDIGKINSWRDNKTPVLTPITFPGQDSGKTQAIDTLGIAATIKIMTRILGNFVDLQSAVYNLKNVADGRQTSALTLYSPFINFNEGPSTAKIIRRGNIGINSTSGTTLTDSSVNFTAFGVQVDDYVKNLATGGTTRVAAVGTTTLTLDDNIFASKQDLDNAYNSLKPETQKLLERTADRISRPLWTVLSQGDPRHERTLRGLSPGGVH